MNVGTWTIPCSVLDDSRRIISQPDFIEMMGENIGSRSIGDRLATFLNLPTLRSRFFQTTLKAILNPISFESEKGARVFGYEGKLIVDYCKAIIMARRDRAIEGPVADQYAVAAENLVIAVAKVGIVALIDEATGFQADRGENALQKILEKYVRKEFSEWSKRFPDDFYKEIFRLNHWQWNGVRTPRPSIVGSFTNELVYSRLAPGILDELRRLNPILQSGERDHKHHQHLTEALGQPELQQHLNTLIAMMRGSVTWAGFLLMVDRSFPKIGQTYLLALDDHPIDPERH